MPPRVVPPPSAVATGVWSVALPFPNPLAFAFAYVVRVPGGVIVVDLGWDSDECRATLELGLERAGATLSDVIGVVITHVHPDHYGLAEFVRAETSAWIAMHPAERPQVALDQQARVDHVERMRAWLQTCGAADSEFAELQRDATDIMARISLVQPDHELVDGAAVPDTGGTLIALHTPGHTPGHLCYYDRGRNLLFTGDHILPRVTPNISLRPTSDPDPLADFVASMELLHPYADALVLPGHEWAFDRLEHRLGALAEHHHLRLVETETVVAAGAETVWEVAQAMSWWRPFIELEGRARRSAIGETYSHLTRLARLGRLAVTPGEPVRWSVVAPRERARPTPGRRAI